MFLYPQVNSENSSQTSVHLSLFFLTSDEGSTCLFCCFTNFYFLPVFWVSWKNFPVFSEAIATSLCIFCIHWLSRSRSKLLMEWKLMCWSSVKLQTGRRFSALFNYIHSFVIFIDLLSARRFQIFSWRFDCTLKSIPLLNCIAPPYICQLLTNFPLVVSPKPITIYTVKVNSRPNYVSLRVIVIQNEQAWSESREVLQKERKFWPLSRHRHLTAIWSTCVKVCWGS